MSMVQEVTAKRQAPRRTPRASKAETQHDPHAAEMAMARQMLKEEREAARAQRAVNRAKRFAAHRKAARQSTKSSPIMERRPSDLYARFLSFTAMRGVGVDTGQDYWCVPEEYDYDKGFKMGEAYAAELIVFSRAVPEGAANVLMHIVSHMDVDEPSQRSIQAGFFWAIGCQLARGVTA